MSADAELLSEVQMFALLDEGGRKLLAERVDLVEVKAGELLFSYGDPGDSMFVVKSGAAELFVKTKTGEKMVLEQPSSGDFFGEISLLDPGPRNATCIIIEDMVALRVDRADLDELFRLEPRTALALLTATGRRLRQTTALLRNAATRNVNEEVEDQRTSVMKVADWIANFSGSLPFLFLHIVFFATWFALNLHLFPFGNFDPYPYQFLTLVVSLEAIILSVFVLLSQNRQAEREHVRGDIEYDVNLKAEMQIQHMHEKVDGLHAELLARLDRLERKNPLST